LPQRSGDEMAKVLPQRKQVERVGGGGDKAEMLMGPTGGWDRRAAAFFAWAAKARLRAMPGGLQGALDGVFQQACSQLAALPGRARTG
jgi:hypothetical protein